MDNLKLFVETSIENSYAYNTQKIDLALEVEGNLRHIYEVKTATDTQSIYTAVGQLFMHSAGMSDVEKWIVLPNSLVNSDLISCLALLEISILLYEIKGNKCEFEPNK